MLKETHAEEIEALLSKYADQRSAVLPLLYIAQDTYGYLGQDAIREVATILNMPYTDVFEVVGFYTLFYDRPVGKWMLQVCDDVPCCYLGAEELVATLKQKLGIQEEETTDDGMFTLQRVKCLAACDRAPMLQANLEYIYDAFPERIDEILRELRTRMENGEALSVSGHMAEDYDFTEDGKLYQLERRLGEIVIPAPSGPDGAPEDQKAADQAEQSRAEEPAKAEADAQIAEESPVEASPDGSPAVAHPDPDKADETGAVPAQAPQQDPPEEER